MNVLSYNIKGVGSSIKQDLLITQLTLDRIDTCMLQDKSAIWRGVIGEILVGMEVGSLDCK